MSGSDKDKVEYNHGNSKNEATPWVHMVDPNNQIQMLFMVRHFVVKVSASTIHEHEKPTMETSLFSADKKAFQISITMATCRIFFTNLKGIIQVMFGKAMFIFVHPFINEHLDFFSGDPVISDSHVVQVIVPRSRQMGTKRKDDRLVEAYPAPLM